MKRWRALHRVGMTLTALALCSCALARDPQPFSKTEWKVGRVSCPAGCGEPTLRFLRAQVGRSVHLSAAYLDAPFLEKCEGAIRWELRNNPVATVMGELNGGITRGAKQISPADLEISQRSEITNGVAMCSGRYGELAMARALLVTSDRIILLFEEHSLIELR
jgi:hypothetical protein